MNSIKHLLIFFFTTLMACSAYTKPYLPKKIQSYARLFAKSDPETIFLAEDGRFDHKDFAKSYTQFLTSLVKKPDRNLRVNWGDIVPLLRGIVSHSRYNPNVTNLFKRLPKDPFFRGILKSYFVLYVNARLAFEKSVAPMKDRALDEIMAYLQLENDTMMAGHIISFICSIFKEDGVNLDEINHLERVTNDHNESAKMRMKNALMRLATLNGTDFAKLLVLANDIDGLHYHTGARFNLIGQMINEAANERSTSTEEINRLRSSRDLSIDRAQETQDESEYFVDISID